MELIRASAKLFLGIYAASMAFAFYPAGTLTQDDFLTASLAAMLLFPPMFLLNAIGHLVFRPTQRSKDYLDQNLTHWPDGSPFSLRHFLQGVMVLGMIGSGKSSGALLFLMRLALKIPRSGGIFLCSKPEDKAWFLQRAAEAGRTQDVLVFSEHSTEQFNLLDYEMKQGGDARSIDQMISVSGEVLTQNQGGGSNDQFWKLSESRKLQNSIVPLMLALGRVTAPEIQEFIHTAAYKPADLADDKWRAGFHCRVMLQAREKAKSPREQADYDLCDRFWFLEHPIQDDKPRSSIDAGLMNTLHVYNSGLVNSILSQGTTTTPADLFRGKWWVVDFPVPMYGPTGKFLLSSLKFAVQKAILRREAKGDDPPCFIVADECPNVITSYDTTFNAEARSHRGTTVYLAQSIHSIHMALEAHGHHKTLGLMTSFGTLIVHTLGDSESAKFCSDLLGQRRETFVSCNSTGQETAWDRISGTSRMSASVSEQYTPVLQSEAFQTGLRCGGPPSMVVDGWVLRNGMPFRSGERYQLVSFSQK